MSVETEANFKLGNPGALLESIAQFVIREFEPHHTQVDIQMAPAGDGWGGQVRLLKK